MSDDDDEWNAFFGTATPTPTADRPQFNTPYATAQPSSSFKSSTRSKTTFGDENLARTLDQQWNKSSGRGDSDYEDVEDDRKPAARPPIAVDRMLAEQVDMELNGGAASFNDEAEYPAFQQPDIPDSVLEWFYDVEVFHM